MPRPGLARLFQSGSVEVDGHKLLGRGFEGSWHSGTIIASSGSGRCDVQSSERKDPEGRPMVPRVWRGTRHTIMRPATLAPSFESFEDVEPGMVVEHAFPECPTVWWIGVVLDVATGEGAHASIVYPLTMREPPGHCANVELLRPAFVWNGQRRAWQEPFQLLRRTDFTRALKHHLKPRPGGGAPAKCPQILSCHPATLNFHTAQELGKAVAEVAAVVPPVATASANAAPNADDFSVFSGQSSFQMDAAALDDPKLHATGAKERPTASAASGGGAAASGSPGKGRAAQPPLEHSPREHLSDSGAAFAQSGREWVVARKADKGAAHVHFGAGGAAAPALPDHGAGVRMHGGDAAQRMHGGAALGPPVPGGLPRKRWSAAHSGDSHGIAALERLLCDPAASLSPRPPADDAAAASGANLLSAAAAAAVPDGSGGKSPARQGAHRDEAAAAAAPPPPRAWPRPHADSADAAHTGREHSGHHRPRPPPTPQFVAAPPPGAAAAPPLDAAAPGQLPHASSNSKVLVHTLHSRQPSSERASAHRQGPPRHGEAQPTGRAQPSAMPRPGPPQHAMHGRHGHPHAGSDAKRSSSGGGAEPAGAKRDASAVSRSPPSGATKRPRGTSASGSQHRAADGAGQAPQSWAHGGSSSGGDARGLPPLPLLTPLAGPHKSVAAASPAVATEGGYSTDVQAMPLTATQRGAAGPAVLPCVANALSSTQLATMTDDSPARSAAPAAGGGGSGGNAAMLGPEFSHLALQLPKWNGHTLDRLLNAAQAQVEGAQQALEAHVASVRSLSEAAALSSPREGGSGDGAARVPRQDRERLLRAWVESVAEREEALRSLTASLAAARATACMRGSQSGEVLQASNRGARAGAA